MFTNAIHSSRKKARSMQSLILMATTPGRCRAYGTRGARAPHPRVETRGYRDFAPLGRVCALTSRDATKTRGKHFTKRLECLPMGLDVAPMGLTNCCRTATDAINRIPTEISPRWGKVCACTSRLRAGAHFTVLTQSIAPLQ